MTATDGLIEVPCVIGDDALTCVVPRCEYCDAVPAYSCWGDRVPAIYRSPADGFYVCEDCVQMHLDDQA